MIYIFNVNGDKVAEFAYDAWGKTVSEHYYNSSTNPGVPYSPFRYRGYFYDDETGLYYLQTRYYDPVVGRFINSDGYVSTGIGLTGYNMFAYCNNNPVICSDPDGECLWLLFAVVAVAATVLLTSCTNTSNGVGAAPNYVEIEPSDGNRDSNPNCYSYALGYYDQSYDPGDFSTPFKEFTVDAVAQAVESDLNALGRGYRPIESYNSPIQENEYRIALRVSQPKLIILPNGPKLDWDYHFMVQTSTGAWAEKHGSRGKTEIHTKGNPSTLVWSLGDGKEYYSGKILYYAITW